MRATWLKAVGAVVLLIAMIVGTFLPVMNCDFVSFDDPQYVSKNPHVLGGLSTSGWVYAWTTLDCTNWHPLTWLSLEIDGSLCGSRPVGYHVTNLILHVLNACLLLTVLARMTGHVTRSFLVAALFGLHPLHVESVAWVSERKDVLSTFFLLLTMMIYVEYARRPSWLRYIPVILLFGLGLLAKPMLVTLPVLLLFLDGWPLQRIKDDSDEDRISRFPQRSMTELVLEKLPLLLMAFVDGMTTIVAQQTAAPALRDLPFSIRMGNALQGLSWYLQKTFVPTNLTVFYPHPERDVSWTLAAVGFVELAAISAVAIGYRKSRPHVLFGWLWFCVALLPVCGLMQVGGQAYADRYTYVPHIGLFIVIVWQFDELLTKVVRGPMIGAVAASIALVWCASLTHAQIPIWRNTESLWKHALDIDKNNGIAHFHLADFYQATGNHPQAIEHLERGLQTRHGISSATARCNLGKSLLAMNRQSEAEAKFLAALKVDERHEGALKELEKLLRAQGRAAEAAAVSRKLGEVLSKNLTAHEEDATRQLNYGLTLARQGEVRRAIGHFQKAIALSPNSAVAYNNLALAQSQLNLSREARQNFQRAIELDPYLAAAHFNLAAIMEAEQDLQGAKEHYAEALKLNPHDAESKQRLEHLKAH